MKKLTTKQYSVSLDEAIFESSSAELKRIINNFLELVKYRKDLKKLDKIFQQFVEVYQAREGILEAEVTVIQPLSHKVKEEIINWLEKYTRRRAKLTEKIDKSILGGVIIKFDQTVVDASLNSSLNNFQKLLSNK